MAIFHHQKKTISYDLRLNLLEEDTLFLHGNLASNLWWQPSIDLLTEKYSSHEKYGKACFMEWLGCGKSKGGLESKEDLSMPSLAADAIALVKGLGLSEVQLVGHSTGGLIALFAMLAEPNLFTKALLLDPVSAEGIQFGPEMYEAFTQMQNSRDVCEAVMLGTVHGAKAEDPFIQKLVDDAFHVHPLVWHGIPDNLKTVNILSDLKKIRSEVLVLHGEYDTLLPKEGSKKMAQALPNGRFEEIKGQGHCTNVENPEKFLAYLGI